MAETTRVYLDHAASTPVHPDVLEAMLPYFSEAYGNPSSVHYWGQQAEAAVERSRGAMADVLGCAPQEIIFTACGSESDNLALRGAALARRMKHGHNHLVVSAVEHHAVLKTAESLAQIEGFKVDLVEPDNFGEIHAEALARVLRPDTAVVSIMYANNEVGTVNQISDMAQLCRDAGVPFHTDAVQAGGHLPLDVEALGVDLLSLGAHKFYGPKGVGALYVRADTELVSTLTGGSQEFGLRAGTHNVPLIVGMAKALSLVQEEGQARANHTLPLRDRLIRDIPDTIPQARVTGHPTNRLPNHASFVFEGVDGNQLLAALDLAGFACSSGSACKTGDPEPSQVLLAMGLTADWALGSLRVTLGRDTESHSIDRFLSVLPDMVQRLRAQAVVHW